MKASVLVGLLPGASLANKVMNIALSAKDPAHLHRVIRSNGDIDYGCHPVILREEDEHKLHAIVNSERLEMLKRSLDPELVRIDIPSHLNKRQEEYAPIGTGDRFEGGEIAPQGLGSRTNGEVDIGPILNVEEVHSALKGLDKKYGIGMFTAPHETFEGRSIYGGVANSAESIEKDKQYIYLNSGIHARERGGPDNVIYFISDLLYANENGIGLTYGNVSYTNAQVQTALSTGIVFVPLTNPDGVVHDQANSNFWRKNRNPASSNPDDPSSIGVDLNRNFDFLWNYTQKFDPSLEPASNDPSSEAFYGTAPFSEPESQNVAWIYEEFKNVHWFLDVHSAAGTLLYSWGVDDNQSEDPNQNFMNAEYDGKRGPWDEIYGEYISAEDWENIEFQANQTTAAMHAVGGRDYVPQQSVGLYPTSGATDDWAFSRWHKDNSLTKVYGYTMEFGYPTNFYPTSEEYIQNIIDTSAGFMEFCLTAAEIGLEG